MSLTTRISVYIQAIILFRNNYCRNTVLFDRLPVTGCNFTTNEGFSTIFKRPEHKMAVYALLAVGTTVI